MSTIDTLSTPAVLIDLDRVEANLKRAQDYADAHGLPLRPHIKTHKLPRFARRQIELGAAGIACQKLGEAEVMADAGLDDILIPYNILGEEKLGRMKALARRIRLRVCADSRTTIEGYARAMRGEPAPLGVLVECDTGMGRCGVQTPEEALALARAIDAAPDLSFDGLMTYPPAGRIDEAAEWLGKAVELLAAAGLPARIVSSGGTPDLWSAHKVSVATEHRPGTYIYLDLSQVKAGVGTVSDCALTVLATVVSRPTPNRAIIDAGSKTLTSDTLGLEGFGLILEAPDARIVSLSEEHGTVLLPDGQADRLKVGDRVRIVPNHACPVSNLFDTVYLVSGTTVVAEEPVAARGKVT
ncbi:D-TA family PLP-dependent enzyme [Shinella pollutisoli]|uniref:D-TA family PLP-dependent enzyme n=1 Tax=Shinella pollutisoli TaxID=2250594 RepID=A0ABV7DN69_9HYPH|nr:D-TA family PLP-dependent enzyme [Shinella pollutisoli]